MAWIPPTLAAATNYYFDFTSSTSSGNPWLLVMLDGTASHALTGNVTYGGSTEDQLAKNWYTAELGDVAGLRSLLVALRNVDQVFDAYRVTPSA